MNATPIATLTKNPDLETATRRAACRRSGRSKTALRRLGQGEKLGGRLRQLARRFVAGLPQAERIVLVRERRASRGLHPEGVLVEGRALWAAPVRRRDERRRSERRQPGLLAQLPRERPLERLAGLDGAAGELPVSGDLLTARAREEHIAAGAAARESADDGSRRPVLWDVRHGRRLTHPRVAGERASTSPAVRTAVRGRGSAAGDELAITGERG